VIDQKNSRFSRFYFQPKALKIKIEKKLKGMENQETDKKLK
jgi:hypothetical protein